MIIIKLIGYVLIIWGVADFGFSWGGIDLWWSVFGIILPDPIYTFSPLAEIVIGGILTQVETKH